MTTQGSLFDTAPEPRGVGAYGQPARVVAPAVLPPVVHAVDPVTSREAAEKHAAKRGPHMDLVLAMVRRNPGRTACELWADANADEARDLGEVGREGPDGDREDRHLLTVDLHRGRRERKQARWVGADVLRGLERPEERQDERDEDHEARREQDQVDRDPRRVLLEAAGLAPSGCLAHLSSPPLRADAGTEPA